MSEFELEDLLARALTRALDTIARLKADNAKLRAALERSQMPAFKPPAPEPRDEQPKEPVQVKDGWVLR